MDFRGQLTEGRRLVEELDLRLPDWTYVVVVDPKSFTSLRHMALREPVYCTCGAAFELNMPLRKRLI